MRTVLAALAILVILVPLTSGCKAVDLQPPPTPQPTHATPMSPLPTATPPRPTPPTSTATPELAFQSYVSPTLGLSLSYPADWVLRETETGVVCGTSLRVVQGGALTDGAGLAVSVDPLADAPWQDVGELCVGQASVFRSEEMQISAPQSHAIGGQDGAMITLEGRPPLGDTPMAGMVAVTIWQEMAYTFVGLSVAEQWSTYGPSLERMIDEVRFTQREKTMFPPDGWEPDDSIAEASEIEMGAPQAHDLHIDGDRDYVRFQATRGHVYTIETANLAQHIDTRIFLYDHEGKLLAQNDDGRAAEELWASRLIWTAEKTNVLYLMVKDLGDDHAGPGTSYDLRIWEEVHFVEDEYEPDDSPALATLLKPGLPQPHNLHIPGDQDWVRFEATAGNIYVIETYNLGPDVDTMLHLFDEEGNELVWDDNGRAEDEALASRIVWTAQRGVSLYVMVHDAEDDAAGPGTEYSLRLIETWP